MESESGHKSSGNSTLIISFVVLLAVVGVGAYYFGQKSVPTSANMQMQRGGNFSPRPSGRSGGMGPMTPAAPPALSDQQTEQLKTGFLTKVTEKTFNITGGNFYFVPNKITVNKGDKVTFIMTNGGGVHDLVIDELNVKTPMTKSGGAATATFTADKSGTFTYYCSVSGHKEKGMLGTLTVQ